METAGQAAVTEHFVYNGANVWADLNGNDETQVYYVFGDGPDQILARVDQLSGTTGRVLWYLTDRLGSVAAIGDGQGAVLKRLLS